VNAEGIPIVVVHRGWKPYLGFCLQRAAACRRQGRLVLLGDDASAHVTNAEHRRIDDAALQDDVAEFRSLYRHCASALKERFEQFCIERWFLVRNLMRRERFDRCLAIDSDVLLFCDVAEESARFRDVAMTFARWDAVRLLPHCNFIGCREAIESFCDYVLEVYRTPAALEAVKAANAKRPSRHWVSDMPLFHAWSLRGEFPLGSLEATARHGVGYDDCIDRVAGFRPRSFLPGVLRPWKWIEHRDGVPYARHLRNGDVPMKCLHFHGAMKDLMARHARGSTDDWRAGGIMLRRKLANIHSKARFFAADHLWPRRSGPKDRTVNGTSAHLAGLTSLR